MTFSTRNFDPLTPLAPKFPNFATQILLSRLKHTVAVVTHAHVLQNFFNHLGTGRCLPKKQRLGPKLAGVWARGASEKNGDPLLISATFEASNFKFGTQLGFGLAYQKTTFWTKIGGSLGQGSIRKNLGPFTYFCNR